MYWHYIIQTTTYICVYNSDLYEQQINSHSDALAGQHAQIFVGYTIQDMAK